jgi:hypothetical protein
MVALTLVAGFFGVLLLTLTTSQFAWTQTPATNSTNPAVFPPDSQPYGLTYGEWTAK